MRRELETTWWITIIFSRRVNWKEIECFHSTVCCVIRVVDDIDDTFYSAVMRHNITHNKHALMQTNLICFYLLLLSFTVLSAPQIKWKQKKTQYDANCLLYPFDPYSFRTNINAFINTTNATELCDRSNEGRESITTGYHNIIDTRLMHYS